VKQYEEETNLRASIVLDVSRSMDWRGEPSRLTKLAYAEQLSASLALLLLRQRDAVGIVRFDDRVRSSVPPRSRRGQWRRIVGAIQEAGGGRGSDAANGLEQAARLISRRGLVILVSDLLMEQADVLTTLRSLRAAGHDVTVLHVLDPGEIELGTAGEALFVDPESDESVAATVADVRNAYRTTVEEIVAEWRRALGGMGARYELVPTDSPFAAPLRKAFSAREALA
jgi:uncharacterized protein (DUF58 family)